MIPYEHKMVLVVKKLILDKKNIQHIARHYVSIDELREVFDNYFFAEKTKQKRRLVIGETLDGRIIVVPLEGKGKGRFYPLTAYDANLEQTQRFLSAKAKKERG
jgi:uncharacterized DUF497 family protein